MLTEAKRERLDDVFSYHAPTQDQQSALIAIRASAQAFAATVILNTPESADQSAALRKIREAVMTANAAVVLQGRGL